MKDTIIVKRANVVLDISPDQKDYYLNQGYSVVDDKGNIVEDTKIQTVESLNRRIKELQKIIDDKDAEIAKLKKGNSRSKRED